MTNPTNPDSNSAYRAYLMVGIAAAVVSAATAVYIFRSRTRPFAAPVETVQDILDRCRDQVRDIEQHMSDLHQPFA